MLGVLVLVHELGHFLFAKKAQVDVEEFGLGYPPRAYVLGRRWGTLFSLNWIPFGGFVKIFGENYEEEDRQNSEIKGKKIFSDVSKFWQVAILFGGVLFNIIFAFILFSTSFMIGVPAPQDNSLNEEVSNPKLTVMSVLKDSPAFKSDLKVGDVINRVSIDNKEVDLELENVISSIKKSEGAISLSINRGKEQIEKNIKPENVGENGKIIGVQLGVAGTVRLPFHKAIMEGANTTFQMVKLTVLGIINLIGGIFVGKADISQVTGPVGIVGLVGNATLFGFAYLLTFAAQISISLAVINMVPFPALDGGRILFVLIEAVKGSPLNKKFALYTNTVGFFLLITLMIVVTYRDIAKLF